MGFRSRGTIQNPNQIKLLLLSHHHSTCALVSEILESVLQTVQKQFTYNESQQLNNCIQLGDTVHTYRLIQKTVCRIHIHIVSTHSVLLDILTVINTHSTQYVQILLYVRIYTHNNMQKKVQQIIHRPDTQCHGCALDGIQW